MVSFIGYNFIVNQKVSPDTGDPLLGYKSPYINLTTEK